MISTSPLPRQNVNVYLPCIWIWYSWRQIGIFNIWKFGKQAFMDGKRCLQCVFHTTRVCSRERSCDIKRSYGNLYQIDHASTYEQEIDNYMKSKHMRKTINTHFQPALNKRAADIYGRYTQCTKRIKMSISQNHRSNIECSSDCAWSAAVMEEGYSSNDREEEDSVE